MSLSRTQLLSGAAVLAIAALVAALWSGEPKPPQELIRRAVIQMADAAERRDLGEVLEHVSERFKFQHGGKDEARRFLAAQLFRGEWVKVWVVDTRVDLTSDTTAEFTGRFVLGRSQASTLEELVAQSQIQSWEISGTLEHEEGGRWRFLTATWRPFDPKTLL